MKIELTKQEAEQFFYTALCNGLDVLFSYGLELRKLPNHYNQAAQSLRDKTPNQVICYEDILMEILRNGNSITLYDTEGVLENNPEIFLKDIYERMPLVPVKHLVDMLNEWDDAETADVVLQTVFYKEIIFG